MKILIIKQNSYLNNIIIINIIDCGCKLFVLFKSNDFNTKRKLIVVFVGTIIDYRKVYSIINGTIN